MGIRLNEKRSELIQSVRSRLSINHQTVKIRYWMGLADAIQIQSRERRQNPTTQKDYYALSGDFDFHHNRTPPVPLYAYGLRLLVFGAFLTVCQRVKKLF